MSDHVQADLADGVSVLDEILLLPNSVDTMLKCIALLRVTVNYLKRQKIKNGIFERREIIDDVNFFFLQLFVNKDKMKNKLADNPMTVRDNFAPFALHSS